MCTEKVPYPRMRKVSSKDWWFRCPSKLNFLHCLLAAVVKRSIFGNPPGQENLFENPRLQFPLVILGEMFGQITCHGVLHAWEVKRLKWECDRLYANSIVLLFQHKERGILLLHDDLYRTYGLSYLAWLWWICSVKGRKWIRDASEVVIIIGGG